MSILNYIYFLIITALGIKLLASNGQLLRSPLDCEVKMRLTGPEMFWIFTFATGLLAFQAEGIGTNLMALRLLVLMALCAVGIFVCKNRVLVSLPLVVYFIYLGWLFYGLTYTASWLYGIRVILKYCYPLVVALFASAAVRNVEIFLSAGLWARRVAVASLIVGFIPFVEVLVPGVFWYGTARAISYISMIIFSLSLVYFTYDKRKNFVYAVLFILPCFLWVLRTSIMGSIVAVMAFYFIMYRVRSLPIIAGIFIAGVIAVFTIPALHDKMFRAEAGDVTIEQFQAGEIDESMIDANARFAMWEHLQDRFYKGKEMIGSGTGSVQNYMYNNRIYGGLRVAHSDFVQIMCDNGLVGLVLYCAIALSILGHCVIVYARKSNGSGVRLAALCAGASMMGVFITCYSDNTVNYSMCTLSMPFGFYGMMLGLGQGAKEQR